MINYWGGIAAVIVIILHLNKKIKLFRIKKEIKSKEPLKVIEGADTFFLEGKENLEQKEKIGILFIHGFTSTTDEFKEMGKYLHENGFTVYCPLLSGHGTIKEHLYCVNPKNWLSEVNEGIKKLEQQCEAIYLVGCSFGGNLALLSAHNSEKIKGIITLGTPFVFRGDPLAKILVYLIKPFKLFRKKRQTKRILEVYKKNKRISYKELPLGPLAEVFKIIEASKKSLPKMKKDILFIQANNDHIFNEKNIKYAYDKIGSKIKEVCIVHNTIHVFIMDDKRWKVYEEIENFITRKRPTLNSI